MTWDPTHPPTSGAIVSAPMRDNFAALDTMLVAALAGLANGQVLVKLSGPVVGGVPVGTDGYVLMLVSSVPTWQPAPESFHNPMTAPGDVIVGGTAGAPARLGVGSAGQYLTVSGGSPAWSPLPVDPGFANPMSAPGDLITGGAAGAPGRLGVGTAGQVLTVVAGAPAWAQPDAVPLVRNLLGAMTAGSTSLTLTAEYGRLRNPTAKTTLVRTALSATLNNATAGPVANGRDQAASFGTQTWVHLFWITDGTTDALLSSLSATAPTLPAGYTHFAYLTSLRVGATANAWALTGWVRGASVFYNAEPNVLSAGGATAETAISLATVVPPNALTVKTESVALLTSDASGLIFAIIKIRVVSGSDYASAAQFNLTGLGASTVQRVIGTAFEMPNVNQNCYYLWASLTGSSPQFYFYVIGYTVPNS